MNRITKGTLRSVVRCVKKYIAVTRDGVATAAFPRRCRARLEAHALVLRTVLAISEAVHLSRDCEDRAERAVEAIAT